MTKAPSPSTLVLNQQDAAKALGRSSRWLSTQDAPRLSKAEGGGYPLPELVEWFVDRETEDDLRSEKTRKEIAVLEERKLKLELERQLKEQHLVDIRDLNQGLEELGEIMRSTGDTLARKRTLTGRDAVELWNSGLDKYERKRRAMIENRAA